MAAEAAEVAGAVEAFKTEYTLLFEKVDHKLGVSRSRGKVFFSFFLLCVRVHACVCVDVSRVSQTTTLPTGPGGDAPL